MPEALVDSHCHLTYDKFDADRAEVIARAKECGVTHMLNPGLSLEDSMAAIHLSESHGEVYAAVGIHPNSGKEWDSNSLAALRGLTGESKVVAIGEIGLDYYWDETPRNIQEQVFWHQLELASEVELPIIVHNREATQDVLRILSTWKESLKSSESPLIERPGVLHAFSGNVDDAVRAIDMNFMLGVAGPVTFRKSVLLQEVVREAGLESLLVETDSPFLSPEPNRGERNEPSRVRRVAEKIGELKDIPLQQVAEETTNNAARLFRW